MRWDIIAGLISISIEVIVDVIIVNEYFLSCGGLWKIFISGSFIWGLSCGAVRRFV